MNTSPRILIVEDEVLIADYIMELLQEEDFTNIRMAHDKETAILEMDSFFPEIILMDINIQGLNEGIELSKLKNDNAAVIFLTGQYDMNLMAKAFETNPEAYLTKPVKKHDLIAAIQLQLHKQKLYYITVKDGYNKLRLNLDDVLFFKSDNNYIDIQLTDKKITIRQSLNKLSEEIQSKNFIRIHRSYIINKTKITTKNSSVIFINEFEIPYSRNSDVDL